MDYKNQYPYDVNAPRVDNTQPYINPQIQYQPYPQQPIPQPTPVPTPITQPTSSTPVIEQSYIENILRLNKGKVGTFYFTYTDSNEWRDRVYKGVIEAAGRDHIIISDPKTGKRFLLLMLYLIYVEFDEEINYDYPFRSKT